MDESEDIEACKSMQRLPDSIHSLLGLNSNVTASWFKSVCSIIKDLQSSKSGGDTQAKSKKIDEMEYTDSNDSDKNACLLKIQGTIIFVFVSQTFLSKGELASLNSQLKDLSIQRRQALNDFLDLKGNIRVFCRVRPFLPDENCGCARPVLTSDSSKMLLRTTEKKSKQYSFDKVFHPQSTQEEVFSEIEPVIKSALDGYNVCIFAYGQTGTGKTYSMEGIPSNPGIVPRGIQAIFEQALESNYTFQFSFSMLEIYMGSLRDLLVPRSKKLRAPKAPRLSIQMNSIGGIEIENLICVEVCNFEQVKRLYNLGKRSRSTASTKSNSNSSRSHCLICITITCSAAPERQKETNKIWMIDLGGSERLLKTQATGRRMEEGKAINLSLSALGDVISALQQKKSHVPYRNSKLTQVLKDSLGLDSKTLMFVHVSPKEEDLCETICSLGFATRAKSIHLESEESPELKAKKEVEMTKMEQKLTELESEQKDIQREIQKLIERQKLLMRSNNLSYGHTEDSLLFAEEVQLSESVNLHNASNSTRASPNLPRFMKPTLCSQKKTTSVHLSSTSTRKKSSNPSKMRRSISVYAESVNFESQNTVCLSECGSEFSMSTSYVGQGHGADDDTTCSQGTSEYEIKQVIFSVKEKSPTSSTTSHPHECSNRENIQVEESNNETHSSIEDWLHLQITGQAISQTACGKRVFAIPIDKRNNMCSQQNRLTKSNQEEIQSFISSNTDSTSKTNLNDGDAESLKRIIVDGMSYEMEDSESKQSQDHDQVSKKERINCEDQEEFADNISGIAIVSQVTKTPESTENIISVDSYNKEFSGPQQHKDNQEESCLHFRRTRRSLFAIHPSPIHQPSELKESTKHINRCQDKELGTDWLFFKTLQALWVSILVGLGIHSLGLGSNFFDGLLF
ncbi:kinesin KP1 isoform X2 [Canna indica]|uniref:Kinesin KP1 isoform X2 n=1 Tax=Canna indica TaxID=4628 RepID=A0AAQ3KI24_9LILI|nr:kinesin KP1 isoform X2 [Canna indica]